MTLRENEILAYMLTSLINRKVELVPWFKISYVNLFGFVFGKVRVNEWPLSGILYFNLYDYKFDKFEGWTHSLIRNMIFEPIWF